MKIKKAAKSDLPAITELYRKEFSEAPYAEQWSRKIVAQKMKRYFQASVILLCRKGKEIAGFVVSRPEILFGQKACFIDELVVAKSFQRKGVGGMLLHKAETEARKRKMKATYLLALNGCPAQEFYKRRGYSENNWVLMQKEL